MYTGDLTLYTVSCSLYTALWVHTNTNSSAQLHPTWGVSLAAAIGRAAAQLSSNWSSRCSARLSLVGRPRGVIARLGDDHFLQGNIFVLEMITANGISVLRQPLGQRMCIQGVVMHYTALHCTALHCTALHCTALHCTALHCTALHCTALHCTALNCTMLYCTTLHCSAPYTVFIEVTLQIALLK